MATPKTRPKAAVIVATEMRRQIVAGDMKPGDKLIPESDLQTEFAVSRPTLREALRLLESESLTPSVAVNMAARRCLRLI
ncbi:MAG: winged helix-turn-helix domain-containing protein [Paracoccaceae bacterium]